MICIVTKRLSIFALTIVSLLVGTSWSWAGPLEDAKAVVQPYLTEYFGYTRANKLADAMRLTEAKLREVERDYQDQPLVIAFVLESRAVLYDSMGRQEDAIPLYQRLIKIEEQVLGADHLRVSNTILLLAITFAQVGRFAEAQQLCERAVAIREKHLGPDDPEVADALRQLAATYRLRGFKSKVEPLLKRSIAIHERQKEPDLESLAGDLSTLAGLLQEQGRFAEAEALFRRVIEIEQKIPQPDDARLAEAWKTLATLYMAQGRYAEAEPLYKRSLAKREELVGRDNLDVGAILDDLGLLYQLQGRYRESEALYLRALSIAENWGKNTQSEIAYVCNHLAGLYLLLEQFDKAEQYCQRGLENREKLLGPDHDLVADSLIEMGKICAAQRRFPQAQADFQRAVEILERQLGLNSPRVADALYQQSRLYCAMGKFTEAEPLSDRALSIRERAMVSPGERSDAYADRARISWELGRRSEAVADLKQSLELAEEQRGQVSGAEHERAAAFAEFAKPFEQMVAWQVELGDFGEALSAMERARARSLLDEMQLEGADLNLARSTTERTQLNDEESKLKAIVADLETQLAGAQEGERAELEARLAQARSDLYDHYRDERNSNPVYRTLLGAGSGPPRLSQLQRRVAAPDALLLAYHVGNEAGYLLSIDAKAARLTKLELTAAQAKILGVEPGPLHADRLAALLVDSEQNSILPQLASPSQNKQLSLRLAALWEALIPAVDREALVSGKYQRLIIIPDGSLALLPFETLVVENTEEVKYLLDAGPSIQYAPSATVLYNLLERPATATAENAHAVLTVGDPAYAIAKGEAPANAIASSGSRYSAAGGELARLPYSGTESRWVAKNFSQQGVRVADLLGAQATEQNVRAAAAGCDVLHLACHGLTDQAFGNFFGALALTPGPRGAADAADDGFLSLPEIYQLDLKNCELAILSACQTNYGPQQKGEGVWALSRGFLVAGSRRVVASNWLVDDEAAASLVSYFTAGLAQAEKQGASQDYAQALHSAKRWVRGQKKWHSPYYWGTFVLVGPN